MTSPDPRAIIQFFFSIIGSVVMAASAGYAILFVVGEAVEHFTR